MTEKKRPSLFVGSSTEGLAVAYAVQTNLQHDAEVTVWPQGVFQLSRMSLDSLTELLDRTDFGVFIFSPDDLLIMRGKESSSVRDNVIFELGLFVGRLGKERSFILTPGDQRELHLPTDLIGMTPATYDPNRSDGSVEAATGPACQAVRQAIRKLGFLNRNDMSLQLSQGIGGVLIAEVDRANTVGTSAVLEDQGAAEESKLADDQVVENSNVTLDWLASYNAGNYREAHKLLVEVVDTAEDKQSLLYEMAWLGRVEAKLDFSKGVSYLKGLQEAHPESDDSYLALADVYNERGLTDEALAILNEGMTMGESPWISQYRAQTLMQDGDVTGAKMEYAQLIESNPSFVEAYLNLGAIYESEGLKSEAIQLYKDGLLLTPGNEQLLSKIGSAHYDLGQHVPALLTYRKLVKMNPDNGMYYVNLANTYFMLDLTGVALEAYDKANMLTNETDPTVLANLGSIFEVAGFYPRAIRYLEDAIKLNSRFEFAHTRLSFALKNSAEEKEKVTALIRKHKQELREIKQKEPQEVEQAKTSDA